MRDEMVRDGGALGVFGQDDGEGLDMSGRMWRPVKNVKRIRQQKANDVPRVERQRTEEHTTHTLEEHDGTLVGLDEDVCKTSMS